MPDRAWLTGLVGSVTLTLPRQAICRHLPIIRLALSPKELYPAR